MLFEPADLTCRGGRYVQRLAEANAASIAEEGVDDRHEGVSEVAGLYRSAGRNLSESRLSARPSREP